MTIVYKIRRKSDGLFYKKSWNFFDKKGFTFKSRASLTQYLPTAKFQLGVNFNDCEVVTFELVEAETVDCTDWKLAKDV